MALALQGTDGLGQKSVPQLTRDPLILLACSVAKNASVRNRNSRKLLKYKEMQGGLQIRLRRFDSDLGLHHSKAPQINVCGVFLCGSEKTTSSETAGTQMGWRVGLVVGLVGRE